MFVRSVTTRLRTPTVAPRCLFVISQSILADVSRFCRCSSTVEHLFCKQAVAGSNPVAGSILPKGWIAEEAERRSRSAALRSRVRRLSLSTVQLFAVTARWCNGSTNDSDSFCLGSSPSRAASAFLFEYLLRYSRLARGVFVRVSMVALTFELQNDPSRTPV